MGGKHNRSIRIDQHHTFKKSILLHIIGRMAILDGTYCIHVQKVVDLSSDPLDSLVHV